jgi:hypothetical protein
MTGISLTKFLKDFSFRTCSFIFSRIKVALAHPAASNGYVRATV